MSNEIDKLRSALRGMMEAYERRIRSLCSSPEELANRPWECAEWHTSKAALRDSEPVRTGPVMPR